MAKFTKWADRIGETKEVQGFVFTLFDNEGDRVVVEVNDELYYVSRGTWRKGIFRDILRVLKPKHVGETKVIEGLLAKVYRYAKGKVELEIEANNEKYHFTIGVNTWVKGIFKGLKATLKKLGLISKTVYFLSVISNKPIDADIIKKHVDTLENTFHYKDLRKVFTKLANIYHPDHNGNEKLFQKIYETYNRQTKVLKRAEALLMEKLSGKEYEDMVKNLYELQKQKEEIYGC